MDCLVRLFYGGSVRKEDGVLEDMEEELEMFDAPPSFSDILLRVEQKFVGGFTLKGRFDSGKTRPHYVLVALRNEDHWLRYTRVVQESNVTLAEVVVENGYMKEDVEDGRRVIQESNDQGGRDAMPVQVQGRLVRDVPGPTEVEHAGEGGTLMTALVPLSVVQSRLQHDRGINLDEGHPLSGGVCSESPVNQANWVESPLHVSASAGHYNLHHPRALCHSYKWETLVQGACKFDGSVDALDDEF